MARLRRRVIFYNRIIIRKIRKPKLKSAAVEVAKPSKAGVDALQSDKNLQTENPGQSATTMTLPGEKNDGPVASFNPEYNPYAYMISQLPSMLGSIPDLVHFGSDLTDYPSAQLEPAKDEAAIVEPARDEMPEPTPESSSVCAAQSQVSEPLPSKPSALVKPSTDKKPRDDMPNRDLSPVEPLMALESKSQDDSELWVCFQQPSMPTNPLVEMLFATDRRDAFPWPGLPEQSCRLKRYGGCGETKQRQCQPDSGALFARLKQLMQHKGCCLAGLLLTLSSDKALAKLIADTPIETVFGSTTAVNKNPLGQLTAAAYFDDLIFEQKLQPVDDWPLAFLDRPESTEDLVGSDALGGYLDGIAEFAQHLFVSIKYQEFNVFVEFVGGQVHCYDSQGLHGVLSSESFKRIVRRLQTKSDRAFFEIAAFNTRFDDIRQGFCQAQSRRQQWREIPLIQFVTSSLSDIGSAELNARQDHKV